MQREILIPLEVANSTDRRIPQYIGFMARDLDARNNAMGRAIQAQQTIDQMHKQGMGQGPEGARIRQALRKARLDVNRLDTSLNRGVGVIFFSANRSEDDGVRLARVLLTVEDAKREEQRWWESRRITRKEFPSQISEIKTSLPSR